MTITVSPARNEYTSNAGQTIFNYTFKIFDTTDLNVYVTPAGQECSDSDLTTAYNVDISTIGDPAGGFITFNTPLNEGDLVTIVSAVPSSRTTDYQNNGDFRPDTVNNDFDRVVSIVKKIEDKVNLSPSLSECEQGPKPIGLENPKDGQSIVWSESERKYKNYLPAGSLPSVPGNQVVGNFTDYFSKSVADAKIGLTIGGFLVALKVGDIVTTVGYEATSASGGGSYKVVAGGTGVDDGGLYHDTSNGLQLELIVNERVGLSQYGVKPVFGFDNVVQMQKAFLGQLIHRKPIYIESTLTGYECSGTVQYYGWGLEGANAEGSKLVYTGNSTFIQKASSNDWGTISNFYVFGPGKNVANAWAFGHIGNDRGWFRTQLKNVRVNDFERAFEIQFSLFCTFDTVFISNCKEGHYFIGSNTGWNNAGGWYNNEITFQNCIWDECETFAIDWIGAGLAFSGTNTMQSGGDGVRIKRDSGGISSTINLDNLYFEFNSGKDIDLKDTFVTLGTCVFQNDAPPPSHNIYADNTEIYAVGRPKYLDAPNLRIELVNGSKYISIYPEIVSNAIISDSSSEYIYLPDRVSDKRKTQTFQNLNSTPVILAPPIGSSSRYTNHIIEFFLQAPNGEYTSFTTYGRQSGGVFRTPVISGDAARVSDQQFNITVGGFTYIFRTTAGTGSMSIEASALASGETILITRVANSLFEPIY